MKRFILLCLFSSTIVFLNAQTKGMVVGREKGKPLAGVNIYLQKDRVGLGVTNENGEFEITALNRINANDTITFSYIGYLSVKHTVQELKTLGYQVEMPELTQLLDEVTVEGKKKRFVWDYTGLAMLPKPLFSFGGFLLNGKIYVIAGDETLIERASGLGQGTKAWEFHSGNMLIYDIGENKWTIGKQKFTPRACHAAHFSKNRIFVLGGKRYSTNRRLEYTVATMEIYDMDKDTLYSESVNPHQAVDFTSFIYNDCLYAMGGTVKKEVFSNKIHTLDLKTGIWYEMSDTIPAEVGGNMNGILVGHTVYCFGGSSAKPGQTVMGYDLQTGKWSSIGDLKSGVSYPTLVSNGNWIYVYGDGCLQLYNMKTHAVKLYRFNANLENAGLFYSEGKLYFVGGCIRDTIHITPSWQVFSLDVKRISKE